MIIRGRGVLKGCSGFGCTGLGADDPYAWMKTMQFPLVPISGTQNPIAAAAQSVLKGVFGMDKLAVDGNWGQCSQNAFKNATTEWPTPENVLALLDLDKFGVSSGQISTWGGRDACTNGTDKQNWSAIPTQYIPKAAIVAKALGVPVPPDVCPGGMVLDSATSACKCPTGAFLNKDTGVCDQPVPRSTVGMSTLTFTQTSPVLSFVRSLAAKQPTPAASTGTPTTSTAKSPMLSLFAKDSPAISTSSGLPDSVKTSPSSPGFQWQSTLPVAPAVSSGLSTGAKIGIGAVAVLGVGLAFFALRKKPAVATANRRRRRRRR